MSVFDQMLARYDVLENGSKNAAYEVMQEVILAGLYRGGFFNKAAFYGVVDFEFMSNFMRNIETKALKEVLSIYASRLKKQRNVN